MTVDVSCAAMYTTWPLIALLLLGAVPAQEPADNEPTAALGHTGLDHTGIEWKLPFASAQAQAKQQQRLLFVPVIAGGTNATGCW